MDLPKPNPINGHGGNIAIEACADLVNTLMHLKNLQGGSLENLSTQNITEGFQKFEEKRLQRARAVVKAAHQQQALFAYEVPIVSHIINNWLVPVVGTELILNRNGALMLGSTTIKTLPVPHRPRKIPFDDELPAQSILQGALNLFQRSNTWLGVLFVVICVAWFWPGSLE